MADLPSDDELTAWKARKELLDMLDQEGFPPIEASADGLVTVSIDSRCQLNTVSLHGMDLDSELRTKFERRW